MNARHALAAISLSGIGIASRVWRDRLPGLAAGRSPSRLIWRSRPGLSSAMLQGGSPLPGAVCAGRRTRPGGGPPGRVRREAVPGGRPVRGRPRASRAGSHLNALLALAAIALSGIGIASPAWPDRPLGLARRTYAVALGLALGLGVWSGLSSAILLAGLASPGARFARDAGLLGGRGHAVAIFAHPEARPGWCAAGRFRVARFEGGFALLARDRP